MNILDRYIIKKFLTTFVFTVFIMVAVACVIDYTEKTDDFISSNAPLKEIIFDYYANFIPYMASILSPLLVFISVVFVTSRMASHSEIIAILSAGVSFRRLLVPYLVAAVFLGVVSFYMVGWIIPNASKVKVAFQHKYLNNPFYFDERNIHFKSDDSTYVYMQSYNNKSKVGYRFTIENISDGKLNAKLSSNRVAWDSLKYKWHVERYRLYTFDNGRESFTEGAEMDTSLNIYPENFESTRNLEETKTFPELDDYIALQLRRGIGNVEEYLSEKYERYAYPFAVIVLTLMGVIVSAKKSRQGSGFHIALGFLLAFVYILFYTMSRSIAVAGSMDPMLGAWLPNIVFFFVAIFMYFTVPR